MRISKACRAAAALSFCAISTAAAATPDAASQAAAAASAIEIVRPNIGYAPETEIVVRDWILCVSQAVAEELVRAGEESADRALAAYADLSRSRACGRFSQLRVILKERLYVSAVEGSDAGVFGALVNLSGDWASGFVVYGGLPAE
jgi:hypothetical protein